MATRTKPSAVPTKKASTPTSTAATKRAKGKTPFAKLIVESHPLTDLKPHPRNPRVHPEKGSPEWEVLKESLAYDYYDPLVWNKRNGMLVAGHLRLKVLQDLGITDADVVVVSYDEKTHLARMISANKAIGHDDRGAQKELFTELLGAEFPIELTGYTFDELDRFGYGADAGGQAGGDHDAGADADPSLTGSSANPTAEAVRYVQLLYSNTDYETFRSLLDKVHTKFKAELTKEFGDEAGDHANITLFALRKLVGK